MTTVTFNTKQSERLVSLIIAHKYELFYCYQTETASNSITVVFNNGIYIILEDGNIRS